MKTDFDNMMTENFLEFIGDTAAEQAFLCWILNWYNHCGPATGSLKKLAKELIAFFDDCDVYDDEIEIHCRELSETDVLIYRVPYDRLIVLECVIMAGNYNSRVEEYKERILQESRILQNEDVEVRSILFHTSYHFACDRVLDAYKKVSGKDFLLILEKYEGENESIDLYIKGLRNRLGREMEAQDYENSLRADISEGSGTYLERIAQDRFLSDVLGEKYPESEWTPSSEYSLIEQGESDYGFSDGLGFASWLCFFKGNLPSGEGEYFLKWQIDMEERQRFLFLQYCEQVEDSTRLEDEGFEERCGFIMEAARRFLDSHNDGMEQGETLFQEDGEPIYMDYRNYRRINVLYLDLNELLDDWKDNKEALIRQMSAASDFFKGSILQVFPEMKKDSN